MKPYDAQPCERLDRDRLDELEFRLRGLLHVMGFKLLKFEAHEYRHIPHDDDPEDFKPWCGIVIEQGKPPSEGTEA